jgi:hypothetical protein
MASISSIDGLERFRYVEVDAARLLLILNRFALAVDNEASQLQCWPKQPVVRYFTPEYKLQKLDFLVRYPTYFAYELVELHRMQVNSARERDEIKSIVRMVLRDKEPDRRTGLYRKFLRGAYERLDLVESWWHSRNLVYRGLERRGDIGSAARPQKYYFLTEKGEEVATELVAAVEHAQWYDGRIRLIHKYFGELSAEELKALQYSHPPYREAQLAEEILDLSLDELLTNFERVFGEPMGVDLEQE